jgi:hypothetical protein
MEYESSELEPNGFAIMDLTPVGVVRGIDQTGEASRQSENGCKPNENAKIRNE